MEQQLKLLTFGFKIKGFFFPSAHILLFCGLEFKIMTAEEDFTVGADTRDVLLREELLQNRSFHELMEAANFSGAGVDNFKSAIE